MKKFFSVLLTVTLFTQQYVWAKEQIGAAEIAAVANFYDHYTKHQSSPTALAKAVFWNSPANQKAALEYIKQNKVTELPTVVTDKNSLRVQGDPALNITLVNAASHIVRINGKEVTLPENITFAQAAKIVDEATQDSQHSYLDLLIPQARANPVAGVAFAGTVILGFLGMVGLLATSVKETNKIQINEAIAECEKAISDLERQKSSAAVNIGDLFSNINAINKGLKVVTRSDNPAPARNEKDCDSVASDNRAHKMCLYAVQRGSALGNVEPFQKLNACLFRYNELMQGTSAVLSQKTGAKYKAWYDSYAKEFKLETETRAAD